LKKIEFEVDGRVTALLSRSCWLLTLEHEFHHYAERFYATTVMNDGADTKVTIK
jgi:hypothetical protein